MKPTLWIITAIALGFEATGTQSTVVTTPAAPTAQPSSEQPLLNLNVTDNRTGQACLSVRARFAFSVDYLKPGSVATVPVAMLEDAVAWGDCGNGTEQTLLVRFFRDSWLLVMRMTTSSSTYDLTAASLTYSVSDSTVFPNATDAGKTLTASASGSLLGAAVPSNSYYACSTVSQTLAGAKRVVLTLREITLQAFKTSTGNRTGEFTGDKFQCAKDTRDDLVPILVVGAALASLVSGYVYLTGRWRQRARAGYQSV